jgi:cystathionine beta-lyase
VFVGECDAWQDALIDVLRANRDFVEASIARISELSMTHVEATYLAWVDARDLHIAKLTLFFEEAGVRLSVRLNSGCPRRRWSRVPRG